MSCAVCTSKLLATLHIAFECEHIRNPGNKNWIPNRTPSGRLLSLNRTPSGRFCDLNRTPSGRFCLSTVLRLDDFVSQPYSVWTLFWALDIRLRHSICPQPYSVTVLRLDPTFSVTKYVGICLELVICTFVCELLDLRAPGRWQLYLPQCLGGRRSEIL